MTPCRQNDNNEVDDMYCPKCDMEFREGIIKCTDCGGDLVDKAEWLAKLQAEAEAEAEKAEAEAKRLEEEAIAREAEIQSRLENLTDEERLELEKQQESFREIMSGVPATYKEERDKYTDNKSSASALLFVGVLLALFSVLLWLDIIKLGLIMNIASTVFALACLIGALLTNKHANSMVDAIEEEENRRKEIFDEFLQLHSAEGLDAQIAKDGLSEEEIALERLNLIQDILQNENDIPDKTFASAIAEDLYAEIYEKQTETD